VSTTRDNAAPSLMADVLQLINDREAIKTRSQDIEWRARFASVAKKHGAEQLKRRYNRVVAQDRTDVEIMEYRSDDSFPAPLVTENSPTELPWATGDMDGVYIARGPSGHTAVAADGGYWFVQNPLGVTIAEGMQRSLPLAKSSATAATPGIRDETFEAPQPGLPKHALGQATSQVARTLGITGHQTLAQTNAFHRQAASRTMALKAHKESIPALHGLWTEQLLAAKKTASRGQVQAASGHLGDASAIEAHVKGRGSVPKFSGAPVVIGVPFTPPAGTNPEEPFASPAEASGLT
jgi:hypothetical protein